MVRLRFVGYAIVALFLVGGGVLYYFHRQMEHDIATMQTNVTRLGALHPAREFDPTAVAQLPEPVQRYFAFVFRGPLPRNYAVAVSVKGSFRRPLTQGFSPTTAEQVLSGGAPALMFSGTTMLLPGVWARMYDYFAEGQMRMKAKILSALTVVEEHESEQLNRISLRRWLLESTLFPQALLPGGAVTWEGIDHNRARAIISSHHLSAAMIVHFDAEGRITQMVAEEDGDLTTPYHGSGEHVTRSDYRLVDNQMIPHQFTISRAANGQIYPFWTGEITEVQFFQQ